MKRSELFALFDNAADGVHIVGGDQRIIYWNRAATGMLGYEPEEALGAACFGLIEGGDYEGHAFCREGCPTIAAASRRKSIPSYDVLSKTKAGKAIWLNVSVLAIADPESDDFLAVHMFRDVSRRREAEMLAERTIASVSEFGRADTYAADSYPPPPPPLTRRELEVLQLLATGARDVQIAESLSIKRTTVRNHVEHVLSKLGVHSRLEAVIFAARHGLV